uniref:Uncharacterized protein n=1 Tax=Knipowitschia caucasica TaxID=637954 RepID=A0AAV2KX86_KNICA
MDLRLTKVWKKQNIFTHINGLDRAVGWLNISNDLARVKRKTAFCLQLEPPHLKSSLGLDLKFLESVLKFHSRLPLPLLFLRFPTQALHMYSVPHRDQGGNGMDYLVSGPKRSGSGDQAGLSSQTHRA